MVTGFLEETGRAGEVGHGAVCNGGLDGMELSVGYDIVESLWVKTKDK